MDLSSIHDQPCLLKNSKPRTRMNGDSKEYTIEFVLAFNMSENIFKILAQPGETVDVSFLWDDDGRPQTSVPYVPFSREFDGYAAVLKRNNAQMLVFPVEKLHAWRVKPKAGSQIEVTAKAFGMVSNEANADAIHKLQDDPSLTLSFVERPGGQTQL